MPPKEHELESVSTKQSVNNQNENSDQSVSDIATVLKESHPTLKEKQPQPTAEEQNALSEKHNSPEFQQGLQEMLPQDNVAETPLTEQELSKMMVEDKFLAKLKEEQKAELLDLAKKGKVKELNQKGGMLDKEMGTKGKIVQALNGKKTAGEGDLQDSVAPLKSDIMDEDPAKKSEALMKMAAFARYKNVSNKSVLEKYSENNETATALNDLDKWSLIVANSELMKFIQPNMKLNKIIPDKMIQSVLDIGTFAYGGNKGKDAMWGSVAHETNYDNISGEEAVANFGLDYGGYKDEDGELRDPVDSLSPYVKSEGFETSKDKDGKETKKEQLSTVQNVFYVNLTVPATAIDKVKVPAHKNLIDFAKTKRSEVEGWINSLELNDPTNLLPGLQEKLVVIDGFLKNAAFSDKMAVSTKADGTTKDEDNPLTNLGMTAPGARLKNQFSTINQEYHLGSEVIAIPENSGIWLKDSSKKDKQVASFIPDPKDNVLHWGNQDIDLIKKALGENEAFLKG